MKRRGFLFSLFLLNIVVYCGRYWEVSGCLDWERKALTTFRKALNDPSNFLSSWDDEASDCCKWRGITCHNITGYALKLDLHVDIYHLRLGGRIDPALVELKHLQFLDLSYNDFSSIPIPQFLGSMKELRHLNLSDAGFIGRIPHQLGNLSKLISLKLSSYPYSSLSAKNLWWLTNLTSLKYLDMSSVTLSMASHDWVHVMNKCPSLVELRLVKCDLSYISPTLAAVNFTSLRVLDLTSNHFNSRIPEWIGNISSFVSLNLSDNIFDGPVPYQFSQLPDLEELQLGGSLCPNCSQLPEGSWSKLKLLDLYFSELHGGIPTSIWNIISLKSLYLSFHENISGSIPGAITKLINLESLTLDGYQMNAPIPEWFNELKNLKNLFLYRCMLGPIIADLGGLSSLQSLHLSGNQLNGSIPAALGGLSSLQSLDLNGNQLNGSIPAALGGLSSLQYLDLSGNQLNGSIPASLGGLSSLQYLDLSWNQLNGSIPAALGGLYSLQSLLLSGNQLNGSIPAALGELSSLQSLDLSDNQLNGNIPTALGGLTSIHSLYLRKNQLNGNIPASLGGLSSLKELVLRENQLNGTIPTTLGQLSNLSKLDLSNNSLTGNVSETHFENLKKLYYLDLSFNCLGFDIHRDWVPPFQLSIISLTSSHLGLPLWIRTQKYIHELDLSNTTISGVIPNWFWDFTTQLFSLDLSNNQISGQLPNPLKMLPATYIDLSSNNFSGPIPCILHGSSSLDLSNNQFSGPISPNFTSTMHNLHVFSARGNQISGIIPSSIGKMKSLHVLDLSHNNISGIIPSSIGKLKSLGILDLSQNNISDTIPLRLGNCVHLEALDLSKNHLSGRIPISLGMLHYLQTMHLRNNSLSGEVPSSLQNCTLLETLDLGQNNFSGHIPTWIGKSFPVLRILSLRSNMFTGNIPPQLLNITSLQVLDVGQNCLSGSIPQSLRNLTAMKIEQKTYNFLLNETESYYEENLLVSVKGLMLEYTRTISLVTCIDLSNNNLSGEIPEEFTSLFGLRVLNLSGNHLTGKIPNKIGKLTLLESLDFSKNQLSGTIPQSMSSLTFLSYLNFSNNNFSGKIPSGNQLQTLQDPSIYMGNNDLCGPPLTDKCDSDETSQSPMPVGGDVKKDDDAHEMVWFYSALGPGFAVGFWAFCGVLVLKKAWRIAYYRFFDEMIDRLLYNSRFARR